MKTINKIFLIITAIAAFSCEDILEKDITNDTIQIIAPLNSAEIQSNVVKFQWNSLDHADKYRIQLMSANQNIVLDSLVTQNNFSYPLSQGNYQWRVRAENFAYTSQYTFNTSFSVFETSDLTNQQVILSNPINSYYTNNASLTFNWQTLSAAASYTFELVNVTNGQTIINQQPDLTTNSVALTNSVITQDAEYQWRVKAVNGTSQTQFNSRSFFIDKVNPNQPLNNIPANNSSKTINQEVNFSWSIPSDIGTIQSSISYVIEFSNDIAFSSVFQTSNVTASTFQKTFTTAGDFYWRVKAKDQAGNVGISSSPFKLTVN